MPAYVSNGHKQFFLLIELAHGDDEKGPPYRHCWPNSYAKTQQSF
jgi:hypothetical protein